MKDIELEEKPRSAVEYPPIHTSVRAAPLLPFRLNRQMYLDGHILTEVWDWDRR